MQNQSIVLTFLPACGFCLFCLFCLVVGAIFFLSIGLKYWKKNKLNYKHQKRNNVDFKCK